MKLFFLISIGKNAKMPFYGHYLTYTIGCKFRLNFLDMQRLLISFWGSRKSQVARIVQYN